MAGVAVVFCVLFIWYSRNTGAETWLGQWMPFIMCGIAFLIGIPVYLIAYAMGIVAQIASVIAWFAIVITGKEPEGIYQMLRLGLSYQHRAMPYGLLLTEDWPEFTQDADRQALQPSAPAGDLPAAAPAAPEAPAQPDLSGFDPPSPPPQDPS